MFKVLTMTGMVVFVSLLIEIGILYYQATVGKLPFNIKLLPNLGGQL